MKYEKINGHTAVVQHIFKGSEIVPGSLWIASGGAVVRVEEVKKYMGKEPYSNPWFDICYSWHENGEKRIHSKDSFSFQCRYCLVIPPEPEC